MHDLHNRIDAFKYNYREDLTVPQYALGTPVFQPKAGNILGIIIYTD